MSGIVSCSSYPLTSTSNWSLSYHPIQLMMSLNYQTEVALMGISHPIYVAPENPWLCSRSISNKGHRRMMKHHRSNVGRPTQRKGSIKVGNTTEWRGWYVKWNYGCVWIWVHFPHRPIQLRCKRVRQRHAPANSAIVLTPQEFLSTYVFVHNWRTELSWRNWQIQYSHPLISMNKFCDNSEMVTFCSV